MVLTRVIGSSSALIALLAVGVPATTAPPTPRSVYVTAVDNQGRPVTDLVAADFTLREAVVIAKSRR